MKDGRPKRGMDRDLALKILALCSTVKDALDDLMDTMFIIYQPKSVVANVGDTVTFSVVAMNVASYQWQLKPPNSTNFGNSGAVGNKTATVTVEATQARNGGQYRVIITDRDGNTVTSDAVTLTVVEATE